jgi:spore coat polysaccharide biosynthesis protein SpsF
MAKKPIVKKGELAIILTVRAGSERLPGKINEDIGGYPLLYHIIRRLQTVQGSHVIVATTREREDDQTAGFAKGIGVDVFRGETRDVVERVDRARREYAPNARYVFRALGDMPFLATELVERATQCLASGKGKFEAFLWHSPPAVWPVYGAREFPYTVQGFYKIARGANGKDEREHVDMFYHANRRRFSTFYHIPPDKDYYRPDYRLEIDWPEDLKMVKAVSEGVGMDAPLLDVIKFLDENQDIAALNRERVERTGVSTYTYMQKRIWFKAMQGHPVMTWQNKWITPQTQQSSPVFCVCGDLLGYTTAGVLHLPSGTQVESGKLKCTHCGSSRIWELMPPA